MGVRSEDGVETMELTEAFTPTEPNYDLAQLRAMAQAQNPTLVAATANLDAAEIGVRAAKSDYLPTAIALDRAERVHAAVHQRERAAQQSAEQCDREAGRIASSRTTSCDASREPHPAPGGGIIADCNAFSGLDATGAALQPEVRSSLLDANSVFPFNFTRQPWSVRLSISLPIWDGFSRSRNVSLARAQEDDAREQIRARQIDVDGQVHARVLAVRTAWEAIQIQEINRTAAADQLQLAQDRYRLGPRQRRSRCPTHRTPSRRPRPSASRRPTITTLLSSGSKPPSAAPFAEQRNCK